jgi:hypothetical protein
MIAKERLRAEITTLCRELATTTYASALQHGTLERKVGRIIEFIENYCKWKEEGDGDRHHD